MAEALFFGDVAVTLDDDLVATAESRRAPNNFFDAALIGSLADAYEALAEGAECRAVVLCSDGKHFCAGANLGDPSASGAARLYEEAARLFRGALPVVAAVQGAAIGGGLGLCCSADFRVGCPEARFAANFAQLGFHHGFALTVTLPAIVGQQRALELLYTGRRLSGSEAFASGLCDRLVDAQELRSEARRLAAEIAASAPLAVRSIRATMRADVVERVVAAMAHELGEQNRLRKTADWKEGVEAMADRRRPQFNGR
jgi:2-(1,2-epoxy-1,2-dihydrophenyl)acetyl-CoA isomerase